MYLSIYVSIYLLSIYLSFYLSFFLSFCLSFFLSFLSFFLSFLLSIYLSIYLSIHLSSYLSGSSVYLTVYLAIYLSISLSLSLSVCLSVYLSTSLSASLKTQLFCETSWFFKLDNIKNAAILRDFLIFRSWQHQKRSNSARPLNFWTWQHPKQSKSARPLQCLKLTTSKTKQFCETSFKNGKLTGALTASYQCVSRFFHSTCLKYCACHEKVKPGHTKCCTCHAKSSSQNWRSQAPKCNPSQEISARTS